MKKRIHKKIDNTLINANAMYVIQKLQDATYEAYIVGGGIRDILLGIVPKDFDIATNATPLEIKEIFGKQSRIIGRRFKIVHITFNTKNINVLHRDIIEVSTYRASNTGYKNSSGKVIRDNSFGSQVEDASRRDFTINALYYNPYTEELIDYNNSLLDLEEKRIRVIGDAKTRYIEDPVRILRAIRLAIKLDCTLDHTTTKPFAKTKKLLRNEDQSRMFEEMSKILLCGHSLKCINALSKYKIPVNSIFPLFKLINNNNKMAVSMLQITDKRIKNNDIVSLKYIIAVVCWCICLKKKTIFNIHKEL